MLELDVHSPGSWLPPVLSLHFLAGPGMWSIIAPESTIGETFSAPPQYNIYIFVGQTHYWPTNIIDSRDVVLLSQTEVIATEIQAKTFSDVEGFDQFTFWTLQSCLNCKHVLYTYVCVRYWVWGGTEREGQRERGEGGASGSERVVGGEEGLYFS